MNHCGSILIHNRYRIYKEVGFCGIRVVKDLINSDNDIIRKEEILNDFHIALNLLDYARLVYRKE